MKKTIIVPVSGGKDSQVTLSLALRAGHRPVCIHQNTGYDHPDTYQQIADMSRFYDVGIDHTVNRHGSMFGFLEKAAYFPNSASRGCTQRLKQAPFAAWLIAHEYTPDNCEIWFGMRADESENRASKYGDITDAGAFTLGDIARFYSEGRRRHLGKIPVRLPIVSWTTENVFAHLNADRAPINPLYQRGHTRVGCYPCFLARKCEWIAAAHDPYGRSNIKRLISLEEHWNAVGNKNKFIRVHRTWDVRNFLSYTTDALPDDTAGCGWCSI